MTSTAWERAPAGFLLGRSAYYQQLAYNYKDLGRICEDLEVVPASGDLLTEAQWLEVQQQLPDNYRPVEAAGTVILQLQQGAQLITIGALTVHTDGFCGVFVDGSGNHDWSPGELTDYLKRIKAGLAQAAQVPPEVVDLARQSNEELAQ